MINNAGINSTGVAETQRNVRFGQLEPDGILAMVRVNALGPLLVTQALVELLAKGNKPKVICISSWLGSLSAKQRGGNYGYCVSKAALNMASRTMAFDLAERGIAAVIVNPGWVQTDMGGPHATLTPAQSVRGILAVADAIGPSDAGRFLDWNGQEQAW